MKITPAREIYDFFKIAYHGGKSTEETKNLEMNPEFLNNAVRGTGLLFRAITLGAMVGLALECLGVIEPGSISCPANSCAGDPLKALSGELGLFTTLYLPGCGISYLADKQPGRYKRILSDAAEKMNETKESVKRTFNSLADRIIKADKQEE